MPNQTAPFTPVANARVVEVRTFEADEALPEWQRAVLTDYDAFIKSTPSIEWGASDEVGPVGDGLRVLRHARGQVSGCYIEIREVTKYHGLYEQVEELKRWMNQRNEIVISWAEADSLLDDTRRALDDILAHDRAERDALASEGHCRHGVYVGGCGVDWMCGPCEDGSE
jgi:hypothetical protein